MRSNRFTLSAAAAAALVLVGPAAAGTKDDVRDLQARVIELEQSATAAANAGLRIGQLEAQIQRLTGQVEELRYQLDVSNSRLDAVTAVLAGDQMGAAAPGVGEFQAGGLAAAPVPSTGGPVDLTAGGDPIAAQIQRQGSGDEVGSTATATDVALPLDPLAAFDYASSFLLSGDYPRAKDAFKLYVEAFPNHTRTPDAQFRLGEIHLALSENADAADVFIAHIKAYPNDPRAAEAYLKLGTAFSRMDKPSEACTVFKSMKSKFPSAARPVIDRADLEMARIDCQ